MGLLREIEPDLNSRSRKVKKKEAIAGRFRNLSGQSVLVYVKVLIHIFFFFSLNEIRGLDSQN